MGNVRMNVMKKSHLNLMAHNQEWKFPGIKRAERTKGACEFHYTTMAWRQLFVNHCQASKKQPEVHHLLSNSDPDQRIC